MLTDTHCHVLKEYYDDKKSILDNAKEQGVLRIINAGYNMASSLEVIEDVKKYNNVYGVVGLHPENCLEEFDYKIFDNLPSKIVGIGEIGLDYHWNTENKELQKYAFIEQIKLANELDLPIQIHTRDAVMDTLEILKANSVKNGGIFHCCPFNRELVKEGLKLGFQISFAGPTTFKNSKNAAEIINMVPNDKFLVETDSPYLAPEPHRGTRNDPRNVQFIIKKIAEEKGKTFEEVQNMAYENAKRIFRIN